MIADAQQETLPDAVPPATRGWARPLAIVAGLVVLVAANYYLRHTLEESPKRMYSFLEYFYKPQIPILFGQLPAWRLFLPLRELTGSWCTSTLILIYLVERVLTPAGAWELFNAVSIVVAFATSWVLFRSAVFSFTLAICVGFGTQFYHAYAVTGGIASYLLITYHMLLLCSVVQVIRGERPAWAWRLAFVFSLALNVVAYEGWLDLLVLVWVACPFVFLILRRLARRREAWRLVGMTLVLTAIGAAYVLVKVKLGYGQTQGSESDVVFNYQNLWLIVDDVVSNVFTHVYLSVSNFLPPVLVGASSFYRLGPDAVIASQHRYHESFLYLVIMNQVFFWRYYAGVVLAAVVYGLAVTAVRAWKRPSVWTLALGVFLIMVLVGGPTHTLVKFRPMNSEPAMVYHVTVGVLGVSLLIAWMLTTAWRQMNYPNRAGVLIALVWATIFYNALARPPYLAHMAAQSGLGEGIYPDPMRALMEKVGRSYEAPRGLGAYQLMPYRLDSDVARVRSLLGDLPSRLPPVEQWVPATAQPSVAKLDGGGIELHGDDTQTGYQLVSPPFPIQRSMPYLLRVRFEVRAGRVCAGVLTGDQQRWIVPPDGATAEYAFDSGEISAIRVVMANCNGLEKGNPRSQIRLFGGSYTAVSAQ